MVWSVPHSLMCLSAWSSAGDFLGRLWYLWGPGFAGVRYLIPFCLALCFLVLLLY